MSERFPALLLAALVAAGSGAIGAQGRTVFDRDSAEAEIRRLDRAFATNDSAYRIAWRAYHGGIQWVTVRAGGLTVRTIPALGERTRLAALEAISLVEARGGDSLRSRLAKRLPTIGTDSAAAVLGTEWRVWVAGDTGRGSIRVARFASAGRARVPVLARHLVNVMENLALDGADSTLSSWLMLGRLPLRERAPGEWSDTYVQLATTQSAALDRCQRGDMEACLSALGLGRAEATPLDAWYGPEDYRAVVGVARVPWDDTSTTTLAERCRKRNDGKACSRVVRAIPPALLPLPLSAEARQLFVDEVFRAGGPAAYGRLMSSTGPLRERLQIAAGRPIEDVARQWLDRVRIARPETTRMAPGVLVVVIGWCTLFTGLAAMRRSI
jgi:hypothetical protein